MIEPEDLCRRYGFKRLLNAIGAPTIVGANTAAEPVREAVDAALRLNVEIDELQAAACRVIARATGAEAGCVTSSSSAGLAIAAAAAMAGSDFSKIERLPRRIEGPHEIVVMAAHDVNFGAPISQMILLSGAEVVPVGTANHCDLYHLRGALTERAAALFYVVTGVVNPAGDFPTLKECVEVASKAGVPVVVDAAAEPDVRPFLATGADLVITSAHKQMGAPTSGMLCGRLDFVRACYLQNYGIGRAMKVGKEGILGCMAAVEAWYGRDVAADAERFDRLRSVLAGNLAIRPASHPHAARCDVSGSGLSARAFANALRESDPPIWVRDADDAHGEIILDLRVMSEADAERIAAGIATLIATPRPPKEDPPYHDLYWSEQRLLEWPDWS